MAGVIPALIFSVFRLVLVSIRCHRHMNSVTNHEEPLLRLSTVVAALFVSSPFFTHILGGRWRKISPPKIFISHQQKVY